MVELLKALFAIEVDFEFDKQKQSTGLKKVLAQNNNAIYIAELSGRVVGMCSVQTIISTAEGGPAAILEDLVVEKEYRRKGIGKKLIEAIYQWAKYKNIQRIQLLADKDNIDAIEFYKNNGWFVTNLICLRTRIEGDGHGNNRTENE